MKLARCENGHFYDSDKYDICPHCQTLTEGESENKTVGFGYHVSAESDTAEDEGVTEALSAADVEDLARGGDFTRETSHGDGDPGSAFCSANAAAGSAADYVAQNMEEEDGEETVTRSFFTAGRGRETTGAKPVVGWLVCIKGQPFGQSFPLKSGKNYIGRSHNMDVAINDPTVTRNEHAVIIFEPRKREFIALAGESKEIFYLNDELVLGNEKMKSRDILTLGDVDLVLVPFCDDSFGWEDIENGK